MSNLKAITELIRGIAGQANVLTIPRVFVKLTGNIKAALFLSQCIYWSDKTKRTDGYFYKTAEEWQEDTGLTRHELAKCRKDCAEFVTTKVIKANGAPTTHYSVDLEKLIFWIMENGIDGNRQMDLPENGKTELPENGKSLTETTQNLPQNPPQNPQQGKNAPPVVEPPPPDDKFEEVKQWLEEITGFLGGSTGMKAIKEIVEMGATRADVQGGYDWAVSQNIVIKYYRQLVNPTRTAMAIRIGNERKAAAAPATASPMDDFVEKARRLAAAQQEARYG